MVANISFPKSELEDFCRRNHIRRLSLFGSVLRDDFGPQSDVDFLVEFEADSIPGLIRLSGMQLELETLIGRRVDLRTPEELSRHFRAEALREAVLQYDASR